MRQFLFRDLGLLCTVKRASCQLPSKASRAKKLQEQKDEHCLYVSWGQHSAAKTVPPELWKTLFPWKCNLSAWETWNSLLQEYILPGAVLCLYCFWFQCLNRFLKLCATSSLVLLWTHEMGSGWGEAQRQCEPAEADSALMLLSADSCSYPESVIGSFTGLENSPD